jgi:hypothetical protein
VPRPDATGQSPGGDEYRALRHAATVGDELNATGAGRHDEPEDKLEAQNRQGAAVFGEDMTKSMRRLNRGPVRTDARVVRLRAWRRGMLVAALALFAALPTARADMILLKDGTVIEGDITRKSRRYVRIKTAFGEKSYRRSLIEKIIEESLEGSASLAIRRVEHFEKLPDLAKTLKNADALYKLGRFDEIPPLVEPLIGKGTKLDDMRIRWLLIEHYERQAKWDEAEELLNKTLEDGREPDKIRAQVHLDIFEENPGYKLRKINGRNARDFLDRDMWKKGKRKNALQDPEMMQAALRETVLQILRDDKVSIFALKELMNTQETLAAIQEALDEEERVRLVDVLPYRREKAAVEKSLFRAGAIMPEATRGFELDLVRTEAQHLREVLTQLLNILSEAYPGDDNVATDEHGRLTADGREAWRERCDEFLELSRPIKELIEYLLSRVRAFPKELTPFIKAWEDTLERVEQMQQNTVRNRDRTHV